MELVDGGIWPDTGWLGDRAVPGHWGGDLNFGANNSQIATLVERRTRYMMLAKVNNKDIETVINALVLYASLTWDRGTEMTDHQCITLATDIKVCFCDQHNPCRRGSTAQ